MDTRKEILWLVLMLASLFIMAPAGAQDIKTFVRGDYHHGLPYDQAVKYDKSVRTVLLEMLGNLDEKAAWGNVVQMLGIVGGEGVAARLIKFFETENSGNVDPETLRAMLIMPQALGHLAGQGDQRALQYLIELAKPETWRKKKLSWSYSGKPAEQVFGTAFQTGAVIGLGISAQPKAIQVLNQLSSAPATREAAEDALKVAADIKAHGRLAVFTHKPHH